MSTVAALAFTIAAASGAGEHSVDDRAQAKGVAVTVNDALSRYIETHNDVFRPSVKRLVPIPGIFEAIDFGKHVGTLTDVEDILNRADVKTTSLLNRSTDATVRKFLGRLKEYMAALLDAVRKFRGISENLYRTSQGALGEYKWGSYQQDLDAYEQAIKRYTELGRKLNAAYEEIK